jgi:FkbM family methyltransferase
MMIIREIGERIEHACWRHLGLRWRLRSGVEILVRSRAEWVIYNDIFVEGEYDPALERAIRNAPPGLPLTILDLGANVGYFSLRAMDRAAIWGVPEGRLRIALVEGSPRVFAEMARRLGANRRDAAVTMVNGLAGQRKGTGRIYEGMFHVENALLPGGSKSGVPVPYADIESLYPAPGIIDLLKCDIEGSEQAFIEHYPTLLARVVCAVFELHPARCDVPRCLALLEQAGLKRTRLIRETPAFSVQMFENPSVRGSTAGGR